MKLKSNRRESATQVEASDAIEALPVPYFELDGEGVIQRVNTAASALFETRLDSIIGMTPWDLMAVEEIKQSRERFFNSMRADQDPPPARRSLITKKGEFRIFQPHYKITRDEAGIPTGMRCVAIDVTEEATAHEKMCRAWAWLDCILKSLGQAVLATDSLGVIQYVNPAMERLSGRTADELLGKLVDHCLPVAPFPRPRGSGRLPG